MELAVTFVPSELELFSETRTVCVSHPRVPLECGVQVTA